MDSAENCNEGNEHPAKAEENDNDENVKNKYGEEKGNNGEMSLMTNDCIFIDAATLYKEHFEVDEKFVDGHELQHYEPHEDVKYLDNFPNNNFGVEAQAIEEKLAEISKAKDEIEIEEGPIYDENFLSEDELIEVRKEMELILKMMNC